MATADSEVPRAMAFWELMTMRPLDWLERKGFSMRITPGTCVMASSTCSAAV